MCEMSFIDYIARVSRGAELVGFYGVLLPRGSWVDDVWTLTASLLRETRVLRFLVTFGAQFIAPVHAARMTATLQRHSANRISWNIVSREIPFEWSSATSCADRFCYARTHEFLEVSRLVMNSSNSTFDGDFFSVENGGLFPPISQFELPDVYMSGGSEESVALALKYAQVHISGLHPLSTIQRRIALLERSALLGRKLAYGMRVEIIARETDAEARTAAARVLENWRGSLRKNRSKVDDIDEDWEGSLSMRLLGNKYLSEMTDTGLALLPSPTGTNSLAIAGSYRRVAEFLRNFVDAGVSTFVFSSTEDIGEVYRVGENLLPLLAL